MTLLKTATALMALTILTACDNAGRSDFSRERAESTYRAAMGDYQAGRLDQAIVGLKKTCAANPANASARFQLACLLQDSVKDYAGAFCAYREYLLQCPGSDKAKLAAERLAVCEREMAKGLAAKYLSDAERETSRRLQESRQARSRAETEMAKLQVSLEAANRQLAALREENERLKQFMREEIDAEAPPPVTDRELDDAKALVDKDKPRAPEPPVGADDIADAKRQADEDIAEPPPLIKQAPDAKIRRAAREEAEKKAREEELSKAPAVREEPRPSTYVVQEGDTLYKIAIRFYGHASVWQRIRAANRATISMDGRLRVGQKIVLPELR